MKRLTALVYAVLTAFSEAEDRAASEDILVLENQAQPHKSPAWGLVFSPDSKYIAAGAGNDDSLGSWGVVNLFEVKSMKVIQSLKGYKSEVRAIAFSRDGKTIAAGGYPLIVWEVASGKKLHKLKPPSTLISLIYISDQNRMITTSRGERATIVWDTKEGKRVTTLDGDSEAGIVASLDITKDDNLLATGGDGRYATVWDCKTWEVQKTVNGSASRVESELVRFGSADSVLFAKGDFRTPGKIWRINDGALKCQLERDRHPTYDARFSPDGHLLAQASSSFADKKFEGLQLWNAETGKLLHSVSGHFTSVAFSPDGRLLATGSNKGMISLYRLNNPLPQVKSTNPK